MTSVWNILGEVALENCINVEDITGPKRSKTRFKARREVVNRLRDEREMSWSEIGEVLNRDASTVRDCVVRRKRGGRQ